MLMRYMYRDSRSGDARGNEKSEGKENPCWLVRGHEYEERVCEKEIDVNKNYIFNEFLKL